jgi:L-2-hydroxyglutarate oxidase
MHDFAVVGGGIVGLSTALQLQQRHPDKSVVLLEKEAKVAAHQTGRNSGVIHAGIYYAPGSLKAKFCKEGVTATIAFCKEHDIPYEQCGKLIVATDDLEHERLLDLFERARLNALDVELVDGAELKHLEPNITGVAAIRLKTTGIVSYSQISEKMAEVFKAKGGELRLGTTVGDLVEEQDRVLIGTGADAPLACRYLVVCGGLQADRLANMLNLDIDFRIVPYRGEYYQLPESMNGVVRHLIYPVPDPALPFLGVHLTRMIDGSVTVGPSALQGWKREGYGRLNVDLRDSWDLLSYIGFWRLTWKYLATGLAEVRNALWKPGYLKLVQKYCPTVELQDLGNYPTGVRAMAVDEDGNMIHDFLFAESARSLHVCNAPSPAATSAIPIGAYICDKLDKKIHTG